MPESPPKHTLERRRIRSHRSTDQTVLSTAAWMRLRRVYLRRHPLCADPDGIHARHGETVAAREVDHVRPRARAPELTWDWRNLQGLCKSCHSRKTARETQPAPAGAPVDGAGGRSAEGRDNANRRAHRRPGEAKT